jgi:hypothetical protein
VLETHGHVDMNETNLGINVSIRCWYSATANGILQRGLKSAGRVIQMWEAALHIVSSPA